MPRLRVYLSALFTVIIWGANFVATKVVVKEISPATLIWLRFGMGFAILGLTVLMRKQFSLPQRNEWGYLALLGFLGITFHQWLQATGLQTSQATTTAWIVATIPIITVLLGALWLKERLNWLQIGGIALSTLGVLIIVSKGNLGQLTALSKPGDFLIMVSAFNWAIFSVISRPGLAKHPAAWMMFYVMLFGWLFTTAWLMATGLGLSELAHLSNIGWINVLLLGILGSGVAYIFWYDALQELPASQLGVFIYIEPLVTAIVAAIVLPDDPITLASIIGGALTILGVYLVNNK